MSARDDGPAFPQISAQGASGMSLRDYFAAAALQGVLAQPDDSTYSTPNKQTYAEWQASHRLKIVKYCFAIADDMLREREKQ